MRNQGIAQQLTAEIQPRVFQEQFSRQNLILYVRDVQPSASTIAEWKDVFMADSSPPEERSKEGREYGEAQSITIAATALAVGLATNMAALSYAGTPVEPNTGNNTSTVVSAIFVRPLLKIAGAGTNVVLFWTNTTVNFKPQTATNFSTNAIWSDTTNYPLGSGAQQFTNPATGPPRFFRLRV